MFIKSKLIFTAFILFALLAPLMPARADYRASLDNQLKATAGEQGAGFGQARDPRQVAALVIQVMMGTLGVLFTLYIVYAGFLITLSGGNEEKVTKGKNVLRYSIIGLLITFLSFSITLFLTRYLEEAGTNYQPTAPFYAGVDYKMDEDTSQYYNKDPLDAPLDAQPIFDDGSAKTW